MKTIVPRALETRDIHVDAHELDPLVLAEVEVTRGHIRIMPAMMANELHRRMWRRDKRALKNAGQRHARRTAKHALRRTLMEDEG